MPTKKPHSNLPNHDVIDGALNDYPDPRDIPLSAVQAPLKKEERPKEWINEDFQHFGVNDQSPGASGQPSCTAEGGENIKQGQEYRDHNRRVFEFSPRFIYALNKKIEGNENKGAYLRSTMKVLQKWGVCTEENFESDYSLSHEDFIDWTKIPDKAYKEAEKYRIKAYANVYIQGEIQLGNIERAFDLIKDAIFQNKETLLGATGTHPGWSVDPIRPPKSGERKWGHAFIGIGYEPDYVYCQNSWGSDYGVEYKGIKGMFRFGRNYLNWLHNNLWTSVDISNNTMNLLKRPITEDVLRELYLSIHHRLPDDSADSWIGVGLGQFLKQVRQSEEFQKYDAVYKKVKELENWARS